MNCNKGNTRAAIIVVVLFSGVITTDGLRVSLNWFEAQERCQGRGLTTETRGVSDRYYWTGRYIRLSQWIKILGCYPDSNIRNHDQQVDTTMESKSVGACQDICENENSTTFAVKLNRCTCLKGQVKFDSMSAYSPSHCNYSCDSIDGIYSRECGGEAAHNVYLSDQDYSFHKDNNCMSLQCSRYRTYISRECTMALNKICQNPNASNEGYDTDWSNSMKRCKDSGFPSYLYGNLDLTNASGSCQTLRQGNSEIRWIGIARQSFSKEDQGRAIRDDEKRYFLFCQKCKNSANCAFINCTDRMQNEPLCSNRITTEVTFTKKLFATSVSQYQSLITKEISKSTMSSNSTNEKRTAPSRNQMDDSSHNQGLLIGVIICGILVIILTGIIIILVIYIIRTHKRMPCSDDNKDSLTKNTEPSVTTDRPNSAYTTLNPDQAQDLQEQNYTGLSYVSEYIEMT